MFKNAVADLLSITIVVLSTLVQVAMAGGSVSASRTDSSSTPTTLQPVLVAGNSRDFSDDVADIRDMVDTIMTSSRRNNAFSAVSSDYFKDLLTLSLGVSAFFVVLFTLGGDKVARTFAHSRRMSIMGTEVRMIDLFVLAFLLNCIVSLVLLFYPVTGTTGPSWLYVSCTYAWVGLFLCCVALLAEYYTTSSHIDLFRNQIPEVRE